MKNEELVKFCAEKGVPLPETCKKLNWQGETHLYWVQDINTEEKELKLCYYDIQTGLFCLMYNSKSILSRYGKMYKPEYIIPAPQMHALKTMPKEFISMRGDDDMLCFDNHKTRYTQNIEGNIAQAYAELYIALREKGLI
jgi:hypothetical protein